MILSPGDLRQLLGQRVAVDTEGGRVTGTLVSCNRSSLWLLNGDQDVLVRLADVRQVLAGAA